MRSNAEIKKDIEAELRSSPDVNDTGIAIQVNGGEVTLSGSVDSYLSKYRAEIATRRIIGVTAVANDIRVAPLAGSPTDTLARSAWSAPGVTAVKNELTVRS